MIEQMIWLVIAIVVITLCLAYASYKGMLIEEKIKVLEAEIDFLKLNEEIYNEHIDYIYRCLISDGDKLQNINDKLHL